MHEARYTRLFSVVARFERARSADFIAAIVLLKCSISGQMQRAITREGTQKIFGTDLGCPFTAAEFPGELRARGIKISMDGPGRYLDNVFVGRLWCTVKPDAIYLQSDRSQIETETNEAAFFSFYPEQRTHRVHDCDGRHFTPLEVYRRDLPVRSALEL